jgi:hypothetical protein
MLKARAPLTSTPESCRWPKPFKGGPSAASFIDLARRREIDGREGLTERSLLSYPLEAGRGLLEI